MNRLLPFFIFWFSTLGFAGAGTESKLRSSVASYWDSIQQRDLYEALQHVEPDSRNRFMQRKQDRIRSWSIEQVEFPSENEARVFLTVERLLEATQTYHAIRHAETWVFDGRRWGIRIPQVTSEDVSRMLTGAGRGTRARNLPETVQIVPTQIQMHFLNPVQIGSARIINGLKTPVRIVDIEFDEERFELIRKTETIDPGGDGRLTLRFKGKEEDKDLTSWLRFRLLTGEVEEAVEIPILYNHVDRTTRAFFGLSDNDIRNLKRGDPLRPRINLDQSETPPPLELPVGDDKEFEEDRPGAEPPY